MMIVMAKISAGNGNKSGRLNYDVLFCLFLLLSLNCMPAKVNDWKGTELMIGVND